MARDGSVSDQMFRKLGILFEQMIERHIPDFVVYVPLLPVMHFDEAFSPRREESPPPAHRGPI